MAVAGAASLGPFEHYTRLTGFQYTFDKHMLTEYILLPLYGGNGTILVYLGCFREIGESFWNFSLSLFYLVHAVMSWQCCCLRSTKCHKWHLYQLATRLCSGKHIVKWSHQYVTSECIWTNWESYSSLIVNIVHLAHYSISFLSLAEILSCIWLYCNIHWSWFFLPIPTTEQRKTAGIPRLYEYVSNICISIMF